jgi:hypothetical protein
VTDDDFELAFRLSKIDPPCDACLITSPALRKLAEIWFNAGLDVGIKACNDVGGFLAGHGSIDGPIVADAVRKEIQKAKLK